MDTVLKKALPRSESAKPRGMAEYMSHSPLYFDLSRKGMKSSRCFSPSEMALSLTTESFGASSSSF